MSFLTYHDKLFVDGLTRNINCVNIDDQIILVFYVDSANTLRVKAVQVNNNFSEILATAQVATNVAVTSDDGTGVHACRLASAKAVVCYLATNVGSDFYANVVTYSSGTITVGSAQQVNTTDNQANGMEINCCSTGDDKAVFMYTALNSGTNTATVAQRVATASGTVLTFGTEDVVVTGGAGTGVTGAYYRYAIQKAATDKIVYSYVNSSVARKVRARTITGTSLNAQGTELDLGTVNDGVSPKLLYRADNYADLYYENYDDSGGIKFHTISISGTTCTEQSDSIIGGFEPSFVAYLESDKSILGYQARTTNLPTISKVSIGGSFVASGFDSLALSTATIEQDEMGGTFVDDNSALVIYKKDGVTNYRIAPYTQFYEFDNKRNISQSLQVSWKKDFRPEITIFTIGVSIIGGNDIIGATEQIDSQWNKYLFYDETDHLLSLDWEQNLNLPVGGVSMGLASGKLENTTGRYTPRYMGGSSELFTAVLPRRPFIVNAGFGSQGVETLYPQFVGLFTKQPKVDIRSKMLSWSGMDFINFLQNRYVDNTAMFTGQRSDQLIETILNGLGYATAQYDLDYGINTIPFAIFNKGERFSDIINDIVQAENGQFYQDEEGKLRFENRQHWDSSPHTQVQYDLFTAQVIDAEAPDEDHIINVVEVRAKIREKQPLQTIFYLQPLSTIEIAANSSIEQFFSFQDPVLQLTDPSNGGANSFYKANTAADESGTDITSSLTVTNLGTFAEAVKYRLTNSSGTAMHVTQFTLAGRIAKQTQSLYYRARNDASVTAYEERPLVIENDYIHEQTWAASYAQMVLNDFAEPENLQEVTILAIPQLKLGDLINWQGRHWRVFGKKTRLDPSVGYIQDLILLQRTVVGYFRIGISTIGSEDRIAP